MIINVYPLNGGCMDFQANFNNLIAALTSFHPRFGHSGATSFRSSSSEAAETSLLTKTSQGT